MTTENAKAKGISSFWVIVIVIPIVVFACGAVIKWTNASQDRQQAQFRQQLEAKFQQSIRISDDKHQQALHAQAVLFAYSINKSTCVLRVIAKQQIARLEATKTTGYKNAEGFWARILENQVPIPADFDCSTLPKKPPKGTP